MTASDRARSCGRRTIDGALALLAGALACSSTAFGQGRTDYFNVETPVGQALLVARIANHDYLLVCNTPDNSVEVYDTNESGTGLPLLARIPVGLEPNSITWNPSSKRVYVTCFLSDSVETFLINAPSGPTSFTATPEQSRNVGDEPMDMALALNNTVLLVTFGSKSAMGAFDPVTLKPIAPSTVFPTPTDNLLLQATINNTAHVLKEPRPIEVSGGKLFVLNHKGGTSVPNPFGTDNYDFDVYVRDLTSGAVTSFGNLGSMNWNMRFSSSGVMYAVSGLAQLDPSIPNPTGFVKSMLYRVTNAGTSPTVVSRDLNTDAAGSAVLKPDALTMPTDVVVAEGSPTRVYVAAFGSDRVGVVTINNPADAPNLWTIARVAIPVAPGSTNPRSGPRALAYKPAALGMPGDPGERVYVLNRLDNSVSILAPPTTFVETFALSHDPTPAYIRAGRKFLYSAELSSNGFVSCASCHADGRTDSLGWNLGSPTGFSAVFPSSFVDSPSGASINDVNIFLTPGVGFDPNKGVMITQTLQGLLDTEVAPDVQDLVTNAPYHWRGDRARFTDFNEGFANLLGLGNLHGTPEHPMGIPQADMEAYEQFINSIHYPPNPKEPVDRVFSGDVGPNPNDPAGGSGARRGMKLFHILAQPQSLGNRSCVQCHALPRGSQLKWADTDVIHQPMLQPLDTAQLRGLFQRESRFQTNGYDPTPPQQAPRTGMFGLTHLGGKVTINGFINLFGMSTQDKQDVSQFIHEFDWGVAPMVGRVQPVVIGDLPADSLINPCEDQVEFANCGLAVTGVGSSGPIGYWYDPTRGLYVEEALPSHAITRAALLALITTSQHRLVFRCTPLGSDRRLAALGGTSTSLSDPLGPTDLELLRLTPNSAWSLVPGMTKNWIPLNQGGDFVWSHPDMRTPRFPRAIRRFQYALIDPQNQTNYGLTALRHDAPRRFRIAGNHILPGAKLVLWTPNDTTGAAPNTAALPDPAKTRRLEFPLYATNNVNSNRAVWETAVELAPLQYYALMNGGIEAPGVRATLDNYLSLGTEVPTFGTFNPDQFNWHYVEVVNPDGLMGNAGWSRLVVQ